MANVKKSVGRQGRSNHGVAPGVSSVDHYTFTKVAAKVVAHLVWVISVGFSNSAPACAENLKQSVRLFPAPGRGCLMLVPLVGVFSWEHIWHVLVYSIYT